RPPWRRSPWTCILCRPTADRAAWTVVPPPRFPPTPLPAKDLPMRIPTAPFPARLSLCLALLALAGGCKRESGADRVGDVVALVNGESLSREDFTRELRRELSGGELPDPTQEQLEPLRRALLDSTIERMLILQEA